MMLFIRFQHPAWVSLVLSLLPFAATRNPVLTGEKAPLRLSRVVKMGPASRGDGWAIVSMAWSPDGNRMVSCAKPLIFDHGPAPQMRGHLLGMFGVWARVGDESFVMTRELRCSYRADDSEMVHGSPMSVLHLTNEEVCVSLDGVGRIESSIEVRRLTSGQLIERARA